ncbi:MAG: TIGR01212 family radical SAM protein [Oscillospiraceae bacterium]|nr:TIGR01212 family radical SAM protein [Oscillospiraceae bacterium]
MRMLSQYYKQKYGCKVYKLSLDGGFTCPNRDGTLGTGGCIFCTGSGEFAARQQTTVAQQLQLAKEKIQAKNKDGKYIAYFQAFTNTYGPISRLEEQYRAAMEPEDVVGLAVATRPDCLGREVIDLLSTLNREKPVSVELGLQTIHPQTVSYIRRGYPTEVYYEAVRNLKAAGLDVVTHIIIGLPGEDTAMAVQTTRAAVDAGTDGVKFHLLHVLRGTDLAKDSAQKKFDCLTLEQYGEILQQCIQVLPEHIVVHRITGDGAKKDLIAPAWSGDKKRVLNYLYKLLNLQS